MLTLTQSPSDGQDVVHFPFFLNVPNPFPGLFRCDEFARIFDHKLALENSLLGKKAVSLAGRDKFNPQRSVASILQQSVVTSGRAQAIRVAFENRPRRLEQNEFSFLVANVMTAALAIRTALRTALATGASVSSIHQNVDGISAAGLVRRDVYKGRKSISALVVYPNGSFPSRREICIGYHFC